MEKYCSRLCDRIVTINEEDLRRAKAFHTARVEKIPGVGVNLDRFAPDADVRRQWREKLGLSESDIALLTVGELTPRKNQHVMLEALHQIQDSRVRLYICGRGELEQSLKDMAKSFCLEERVSFLGYRKDIPQLCCAADIFLFTSLQEGLPRALLEAMANGKPIVCSDIRGNVDLIEDGRGGFIVTNDAEAVAPALKKLIARPELRKEMGEYNMAAVDALREEKSLAANAKLIESL